MARAHILLADDDVDILDLLGEYLAAQGYLVTAVQSGAAALQVIKGHRPDIVLLDLWMPEMDGLTTLRRIVAADPTLPIVMVTGNQDDSVTAFALRSGACDYVPKPLDFKYLDEVLDIQLALRAPRRDVLEITEDDATLDIDLDAYALSRLN